MQLNNSRLPEAEREMLKGTQVWNSGDNGGLAWLYTPRIEEKYMAFLKGDLSASPGIKV